MNPDDAVRRVEYPPAPPPGFDIDSVPGAPLPLFLEWLAEAVRAGLAEPNAAALATVDEDSRPAVRTVLVKVADDRGFVFYTNHTSGKGRQLAGNPAAAVLFGWHSMHRQVSVRGLVVQMPREETERYFATRPRGAQIGAWASRQSSPVSRTELERRVAEVEQRFAGAEVPAPPFWGGYLVVPDSIEFWVGRASRLHDRIEYRRRGPGPTSDREAWTRRRLSP